LIKGEGRRIFRIDRAKGTVDRLFPRSYRKQIGVVGDPIGRVGRGVIGFSPSSIRVGQMHTGIVIGLYPIKGGKH